MSSFNGEKFLREQIDSILNQKGVDLDLFVSDDCSTDGTVEILKQYAESHKNFSFQVNEKNKNFTYNFIDALFKFKDNDDYDYYAFADQDDFWLDDKICAAIQKIKNIGNCTLYSSNLKIVDGDLKYKGDNMKPFSYNFRHFDIICTNIVTGCTIVMDKAFKNLVTSVYPENIYLHDYYLALVAEYCKDAHFYFDIDPSHILYRQHGTNMIGQNKRTLRENFKVLTKKKDYVKTTGNLVNVFYKNFGSHLTGEDEKIFKRLISTKKLKSRLYLMIKVKSNYSKLLKIKLISKKY